MEGNTDQDQGKFQSHATDCKKTCISANGLSQKLRVDYLRSSQVKIGKDGPLNKRKLEASLKWIACFLWFVL